MRINRMSHGDLDINSTAVTVRFYRLENQQYNHGKKVETLFMRVTCTGNSLTEEDLLKSCQRARFSTHHYPR